MHRVRHASLFALVLTLACVSCQPASPRIAPFLVITGVTVIDGTGAAPRPDMTVVVVGDRIQSVRRSDGAAVPQGARVVDGRGQFLIPGLWDMHTHLSKTRASALT